MAITDLEQLLSDLMPKLQQGNFVFCSVTQTPYGLSPLCSFKEEEGLSLICQQLEADRHGLSYDLVMKMITLEVYSSLEAVGMTAAISQALTEAGISANIVAAYHHDHVFVPEDKTEQAMSVLSALSQTKSRDSH